ncbi:uncharacterized protein LOC111212243 [Brassica napus]|uniref:uncharacterized protein LOC111212243 n=1 Tax=Brassica napus TaxID=3708 RepID=UPI00207910D6|nr:uncharacterized protein LOC111212243 [Brassica napus]
MVRSMMSHADLPPSFWGYALETSAFTLNRCPSKLVEKTPYEMWTGKNKERDGRDYYGKGKGKMSEAQDSKVKVAEKVHRRYPNYNGHYRGDGEGSRYNSARREDARNGSQEGQKKPSSEQTRAHHSLSGSREETREEGEINATGQEDSMLPSI